MAIAAFRLYSDRVRPVTAVSQFKLYHFLWAATLTALTSESAAKLSDGVVASPTLASPGGVLGDHAMIRQECWASVHIGPNS